MSRFCHSRQNHSLTIRRQCHLSLLSTINSHGSFAAVRVSTRKALINLQNAARHFGRSGERLVAIQPVQNRHQLLPLVTILVVAILLALRAEKSRKMEAVVKKFDQEAGRRKAKIV